MSSFRPHFPRSLLARPEFIQVLIFAIGIHGEEKSVMSIRHELTLACQPLQRFAFEDAFGAAEIIENAAIEDKEASTDQSVGFGFFHEALDLSLGIGFEHAEAGDRGHGCDGSEPSVLMVKLEQAGYVDVAETVAVSQKKCVVVFEVA